MKFVGNLFWFIFAGLWLFLGWAIAGIIWCVTIVGIPWGIQCFKFAGFLVAPFGRDVQYGGGVGSLFLNIIWMLISGIVLSVETLLVGLVLCITIVGIPFGLQCFKYARLAIMPFGARIVRS